jgi:hypothetical protein
MQFQFYFVDRQERERYRAESSFDQPVQVLDEAQRIANRLVTEPAYRCGSRSRRFSICPIADQPLWLGLMRRSDDPELSVPDYHLPGRRCGAKEDVPHARGG